MFLAHRVSQYTISQSNAIIPARQSNKPEQVEALEDVRAEKCRIVEVIEDHAWVIYGLPFRKLQEKEGGLYPASHESLIHLEAALANVKNLARELLWPCQIMLDRHTNTVKTICSDIVKQFRHADIFFSNFIVPLLVILGVDFVEAGCTMLNNT
ncbi:hypothetical protein M422DRAFT_254231 [Sphaerobolus stellatus SS14]|uniref:Uncharacterized protein n=1 Tax=Sphaerobolus stellatus (strain SS14) TaxID=990650 RepID=A0A0C9UI69_SPHS4|nr:hypothetical protein M422DRAFT_254231 [Sphaerobolus stellatus SS14]